MSETSLRTILVGVGRHIVLGAVVGVLCGAGAALFLSLLQAVTVFRTGHEQLVFALPLAGLGLGFFYQRFGQPIAGGTNLVVTGRGPCRTRAMQDRFHTGQRPCG